MLAVGVGARRRGEGVAEGIEVREAERPDAPDIAEIRLAARRGAMPYLHQPHTDEETMPST
jgi:hypothetical protein